MKRLRLKNPNIFVSTTRLCVHNLPTSIDEKELKKIFLTAAGNKARITEVMMVKMSPLYKWIMIIPHYYKLFSTLLHMDYDNFLLYYK